MGISVAVGSRTYGFLRGFVCATRTWPVAGSIYKSLYRAAANSVGQLADREPAIAGIYARNSYALGTWEAGRSDIDLTVVWRHPTRERLDRFYSAYAQLRRRFPMLGEVEMIDHRHLGAWTSHGIIGRQSQQWKKLGGSHQLRCRYAGSEPLDRVRHATSIYAHQFLKYYWQRSCSGEILQRIGAKVIRELGLRPIGKHSADDLLVLCLRELSRAVQALPMSREYPLVDYQSLLGTLPETVSGHVGRSEPPDGVLAVIGLNREPSPRHVLVRETFALVPIKTAFNGALIMDPAVFRFYLSFVDPLEYFTLLRERIVLEGQDPLREPFELSEAALRGTICHYAMDMLTFPYRADLLAIPDNEFRDLLYGWFLRTLRYFEDGTMDFKYHHLRQYFGRRHPEDKDRLALLRGIAVELSKHMHAFESTPAQITVPRRHLQTQSA